ncbi:MAG: ATP-binding protein [Pseudomonas sp.]|uniref:ATP-binding protein n=1 Tax=Pseudomonas sp. TaxID=306 RepID=UPI00356439B0
MNESSSQIGLRQWIWRAFMQSALIPLVLVETILIACYLLTNQAIRVSQLDYLERSAIESLGATADQNTRIIQDQLTHIADVTQLFADMTANSLRAASTPLSETLSTSADGALYSGKDLGGAASFYSSVTPVAQQNLGKVQKLSSLDPLMRAIKDHEAMVASVYFNTWDSYNRIYPWIRADEQYPHDMQIPGYNFYYLADAEHNPQRGVRWTDVYLDPAGHGLMMSAIAPVYERNFLEGVVGLDITVGDLLKEISTLKVPWGGYLMLVGADMKIMVLPPEAEHDFEKGNWSGSGAKATNEGAVNLAGSNLIDAVDPRELAAAVARNSRGSAEVVLNGRTHLVAWAEVKPAGWRLLAVADEEDVMAATNSLALHYRNIGYLMIAGLVMFYLAFFSYMWIRARKLSHSLRRPIRDIRDMLQQIGHGQWLPQRARSSIRELDEMAGNVLSMGAQLSSSEARRNAAQNRLNLVVESITAGLWEYRLDTDRLSLSEAFCTRFGVPACQLERFCFYDHVDPEDVQALDRALNALRTGTASVIDLELRLLRPDGSPIWFLCRGRLIESLDARMRLSAGTFVDIDTLKQVEEDLRRRTLEAQGASKAKSRFISSMSHELRTPLNSIHGFAQLLRLQVADGQEEAKSLDEILGASQHLAHLVDDLLDWSSLQAEAPRLQMRVLEVDGLMRECAEMVRSQAKAAGLDLELQSTSPALSVLADARRLRQILLNLLSNAIKYNRPHARLFMGAELHDKGRVRVFVEDGGAGISAALQGALFEPFQRLGQENTAIQGTGIGLALCRELATLMNGSMGLISETGVGSRFWVDLPQGIAAPKVHKRLLSLCFVGQDDKTLRCLEDTLTGMVDLRHGTLAQCLEQVRRDTAPDVMLIDCDLLGNDLTDALSRLRRLPGGDQILLILLCTSPHMLATLGCEFQAVLKQPLEPNELRELIRAMMQVEKPNVQ